ncbi:MAG: hypothetical protein FJ148_21470 [Deltaproteobacteria bacterium]|nr:hypothetical protein [Deltaproteobacteria bacterium]
MNARIGSIAGLALAISLAATAAFAGQQSAGKHGAGSDGADKPHVRVQEATGAAYPDADFPRDLRETLTAAIERNVRLGGTIGALDTEVVIPD